jgi:hypothetical protein
MGKGPLSYNDPASESTSGRSDASLKDHAWPIAIGTSSSVDLVQEFFAPALSRAICYDRAVGYFSSERLRVDVKKILRFAANSGRGFVGCLSGEALVRVHIGGWAPLGAAGERGVLADY